MLVEAIMKSFNTEVVCNPQKHYMVDISDKIDRIIAKYVENGKYFSINRGRQYGKTSTLRAISRKLKNITAFRLALPGRTLSLRLTLSWYQALSGERVSQCGRFICQRK